MKIPCALSDDLLWKEQRDLCHLDFGWTGRLNLEDPAFIESHVIAVKQLKKGRGVILYQGPLDIVRRIVGENELEGANLFGAFMQRLAAFVPDEMTPYCLFTTEGFSKGRALQLMSPDRFWNVTLDEQKYPLGLLLPQDHMFDEKVVESTLPDEPYRVIPELRLHEMWDGLDELIVMEETLTMQGKRQLQGFLAAGGKVRSRGIRTPDPLLPKQLR